MPTGGPRPACPLSFLPGAAWSALAIADPRGRSTRLRRARPGPVGRGAPQPGHSPPRPAARLRPTPQALRALARRRGLRTASAQILSLPHCLARVPEPPPRSYTAPAHNPHHKDTPLLHCTAPARTPNPLQRPTLSHTPYTALARITPPAPPSLQCACATLRSEAGSIRGGWGRVFHSGAGASVPLETAPAA